MAFTRVRGPGITTDDNYRVGILTATKFVGPMEASGDSDFTNINATGIGTIDGVKIGDPSGIVTASSSSGIVTYYGDASKLTGLTAGQIPNLAASKITSGTIDTARLGSGTANNASFLRGDQTWASNTSTTINNNADNRIITGSGTADTLNGEANLTYNGSNLQFNTTADGHAVILKSTGNYYNKLSFDSGNTDAGGELAYIDFSWDGDKVADIQALAGTDTGNKDDGHLVFRTSPSQGSIGERLRIKSDGKIEVPTTGKLSLGMSGPVAQFTAGTANGSRVIEIQGTDGVIRGYNRNSSSWGQIDFEASAYTFDCGGQEKLRLDSNGDLGLGIAAVPQDSGAKTLHIHHPTVGNPARAGIRLTTGTSGSAVSNGGFFGLDYNNNLYLYNQENGDLVVGTNASQRLRITNTGQVNIGGDYSQTSKTFKVTGNSTIDGGLLVTGLLEGGSGFSIANGNLTLPAYIYHDGDSDTYYGFSGADQFSVFTGGSERLKIQSDGNMRWWPDGVNGVNAYMSSNGSSAITYAVYKNGSAATTCAFKNQNSSGQAQTWMEIDGNQRMHIPYSMAGTDKLNIYTGSDAATKGITITGQDGNNQNSDAGVIRFNGYGQTNGPWIQGKNVQSWGQKDLIIGTKSTTNDYSTALAESMRLTKYGELQLPYSSNSGATINYIEAADFKSKYEGSNWMPSDGTSLRFQTRRNSNTSFITLTGSNDERITFSRACHVLFTMSQDVIGNSDTGYWYINVRVNGSLQSQQLVRKSTQWDQMTFQQHLQIAANGYIELQCYFSGMTGLNIDWGCYSVVAWQH